MSDVTLPAPKRAAKTAKAPATAIPAVKKRPLPPLDPKCPPRFVRQKSSGVVTAWSTLFRENLGDFEPFYRKGTDEEREHRLQMRRYEAQQAFTGARPFGDSDFTAFGDAMDEADDAEEIEDDDDDGDPDA